MHKLVNHAPHDSAKLQTEQRRSSFVRQIMSVMPMRRTQRPISQRFLYHTDDDCSSQESELDQQKPTLRNVAPFSQIRSTLLKLATPIQMVSCSFCVLTRSRVDHE
ncbi:hypothetical protein Ciccas_008458 [Cichlidogyrus casuarinus]|uniref:Uncharacterized protein n=1 Tax=Cichlidogyrus casuarinus TaxID=1844966 RepID=A0ABD2PZV2_9PLAT